MTSKKLGLLAGLATLLIPAMSAADDKPFEFGYAWEDPALQSKIGLGMNAGAGIGQFTDQQMRDTMVNSFGGLWDARVSIGTHIPVGVDVTYQGSATDVRSLGINNGTLVGSSVETVGRYNILPHFKWDPYIFTGIGYQRYDLKNARLATFDSGMQDSADVAVFPMGAGVAFRARSGFTVDMRTTVRVATSSELLEDRTGHYADLHTWETNAMIGYEF